LTVSARSQVYPCQDGRPILVRGNPFRHTGPTSPCLYSTPPAGRSSSVLLNDAMGKTVLHKLVHFGLSSLAMHVNCQDTSVSVVCHATSVAGCRRNANVSTLSCTSLILLSQILDHCPVGAALVLQSMAFAAVCCIRSTPNTGTDSCARSRSPNSTLSVAPDRRSPVSTSQRYINDPCNGMGETTKKWCGNPRI